MAETTLIRENLMTRPGYSPYCGNESCPGRWPRTHFDGEQFKCACGWRSQFDAEFMERYKAYRKQQDEEVSTRRERDMKSSHMGLLSMAVLAGSVGAVPFYTERHAGTFAAPPALRKQTSEDDRRKLAAEEKRFRKDQRRAMLAAQQEKANG